jgi:hypothetical protein
MTVSSPFVLPAAMNALSVNRALSARWSGNPAAICIPQNADLLSYSKICVSCRISPALNHIVLGRV